VLGNHPVRVLSGAAALLQLTGVSLIAFTSILLVQESGWHVGAAGVLLAVALLVSAAGRIVAGWVAQRMRHRVDVIQILAVASGVAVLLLAVSVAVFEPAVPMPAPLAIVMAASGNGVSAGAVSEHVPLALVGTALGVRMTATLAANAVAPIGFGTLLDVVDWEVGLAVLAIPAAASAALLSPRVLRVPTAAGASAAGGGS
jgi:sugar phosphate permease